MFQGDVKLAELYFKCIQWIINLKRCLVFEATLANLRKKNIITEKNILFHENTASVIVQQNSQNTHTRWNADVELNKIHLANQAHESTHKIKCT